MRCMSCHRALVSKTTHLWEKRVVVCWRCKELADKATAEIRARHRAAEHGAMFDLEQLLLDGALVRGLMPSLPGLGADHDG